MLEHHSHLLTGNVDVDEIVIVNLLHRRLIGLTLGGGELLIEKILLFDLHNRLIRADACGNKLLIGIGRHNNVGMKIWINGIYQLILHPNLAVGRLGKQIHATKEGGLTASRRADDCNDLALFNMTVNSIKNGYAVFEGFDYILNAYHLRATSFL